MSQISIIGNDGKPILYAYLTAEGKLFFTFELYARNENEGDYEFNHTAYDINIVGIDPDYTVHVRPDILAEKDGPMLEHGIKEMDKGKLWVPSAPGDKPDQARLEIRFEQFANQ